MFKEHECFRSPQDSNEIIWRYFDFTKYVSLLDRKALYFCRADLLSDLFEGSFPIENVNNRDKLYTKMEVELPTKNRIPLKDIPIRIRKHTYINSWHMNNYESAAMWSIYSTNEYGIAIRTTFERLCKCFKNFAEDVYVGKVIYIDYDKEKIPEDNVLRPFLFKRKSYEYENEIRAVLMRWPKVEDKFDLYCEPKSEGEYIDSDLSILIDKIFVSPFSKRWFYNLVKSITNLYMIDKKVVYSDLSKKALY
jgi:hypothetical protein